MRRIVTHAAAAAALLGLIVAGCGQQEPKTAWIEIEPGLAYVDSAFGTGQAVAGDDFVEVHYTGWYEADDDDLFATKGDSLVKFDSSRDRGEPIAFPLGRGRVIAGWERGLPGMTVGGKRTLRVGPDLAYGAEGRPPFIPGGATLVFAVEVVGLPEVGLTVLEQGTGPAAEVGDRLSVHYTGWLWEDGQKGTEFDSSIARGRPYQFTLGAGMVIQGWDYGLTGLAEGTKAQLVIPPSMGYGARGSGGAIPPGATLCFDIELVAVEKP
ncbi:MAG: FKBP-type peptidyl-prolyl cis-trans isomerase [Krumholzibacteria bacterium]|nr:FKBP-type peptidyl-prolyl cis-trans isomerase [Candidatus Krumholzibacteria bacterium]